MDPYGRTSWAVPLLIQAASAVLQVTESAQAATVETLPQLVSVAGHGGLEMACGKLCVRWEHRLARNNCHLEDL